ncbi:hypothetical protein T492DRAFT_849431, partial [Pavlovales sp. CCMP2436]
VYKLLNDFAPDPVIRLTVDDEVATLDVIKAVEIPNKVWDSLRSPYVFRAVASSTEAVAGKRCSVDSGAKGIEVPWAEEARCITWSMPPVIIECTESASSPSSSSSSMRADAAHGCLAHAVDGQFVFKMQCRPEGLCAKLPVAPPSPPPAPLPELAYCEKHRTRCDNIKVSAVFVVPLLVALLAFSLWQSVSFWQSARTAAKLADEAKGEEGEGGGGLLEEGGGGGGGVRGALLPRPMFLSSHSLECTSLERGEGGDSTVEPLRIADAIASPLAAAPAHSRFTTGIDSVTGSVTGSVTSARASGAHLQAVQRQC